MAKNIKALVKRGMNAALYCSIATSSNSGIWICPVAFGADSDFNLYFVSSPSSRHMKNIQKNQNVAVAIYNTSQKAKGPKVGVQLSGKAVLLKKGSEIDTAYKAYFGKLPEWENTDASYFKKKGCEWPFVKVVTKHLFYFNSGLFGEKGKMIK